MVSFKIQFNFTEIFNNDGNTVLGNIVLTLRFIYNKCRHVFKTDGTTEPDTFIIEIVNVDDGNGAVFNIRLKDLFNLITMRADVRVYTIRWSVSLRSWVLISSP